MRLPCLAAALVAFAATMAPAASTAPAAPAAQLSEADNACLACHGQPGMEKAFEKGPALPLHVPEQFFANSVHAPVGCGGCHADVDIKKHPGNASKHESARAFAVASVQICRTCHAEIFDAYAKSVHGSGKPASATPETPVCSTCHSAHQVRRASVGPHLREACLSCHAGAVANHESWLPNTKLHMDVVACSACHTPGAKRRVDLRLYDVSAKAEVTGVNGSDTEAKPLDPAKLRELLAKANREIPGKLTLVGRLEAGAPEDAHALAAKGKALKECTGCHRKGADGFQNVTLSIVGPDGRRVRYAATSDVLDSPTSVASVRGFYATGGTRIRALDILLLLALGGGIAAPLGHFIVRTLSRRKGKPE